MAASTSILPSEPNSSEHPMIYYQASDDNEYAELKKHFKNRPYCRLDEPARRVGLQITFQDFIRDNVENSHRSQFYCQYRFSSGKILLATHENQNPKEFETAKNLDNETEFQIDLRIWTDTEFKLPDTNATEQQVLASQVIVVGAAHDSPESQEWIIKNLKKDDVILIEFATESDTGEQLKTNLQSRLIPWGYGNPKSYNSACAMIQKASDIGAEILGGENMHSIGLRGKDGNRDLVTDAAFTQATIKVLQRKPHARIFCWAGNGHTPGIIKNLYAFYPDSIRIAEIQPLPNNVLHQPRVYVTPGRLEYDIKTSSLSIAEREILENPILQKLLIKKVLTIRQILALNPSEIAGLKIAIKTLALFPIDINREVKSTPAKNYLQDILAQLKKSTHQWETEERKHDPDDFISAWLTVVHNILNTDITSASLPTLCANLTSALMPLEREHLQQTLLAIKSYLDDITPLISYMRKTTIFSKHPREHLTELTNVLDSKMEPQDKLKKIHELLIAASNNYYLIFKEITEALEDSSYFGIFQLQRKTGNHSQGMSPKKQ